MTFKEKTFWRDKVGFNFSPSDLCTRDRTLDNLDQLDGALILCNAIIMQATADYEKAKSKLSELVNQGKSKQAQSKHRKTMQEISDFCNSDWYALLSEIASTSVCNKLEQCVAM